MKFLIENSDSRIIRQNDFWITLKDKDEITPDILKWLYNLSDEDTDILIKNLIRHGIVEPVAYYKINPDCKQKLVDMCNHMLSLWLDYDDPNSVQWFV